MLISIAILLLHYCLKVCPNGATQYFTNNRIMSMDVVLQLDYVCIRFSLKTYLVSRHMGNGSLWINKKGGTCRSSLGSWRFLTHSFWEYFCRDINDMTTHAKFILEIKNDIIDIPANMNGIIDVLINQGVFDILSRTLIIPNLSYTCHIPLLPCYLFNCINCFNWMPSFWLGEKGSFQPLGGATEVPKYNWKDWHSKCYWS